MSMDASVTGVRAASVRLAVSAHNVANLNTPDYRALRAVPQELVSQRGVRVNVERSDSPADLATEMVDQLVTLRYAQANMKVIRVQSELEGSLVNMFA
jgi:flagellar hook protein FlgE